MTWPERANVGYTMLAPAGGWQGVEMLPLELGFMAWKRIRKRAQLGTTETILFRREGGSHGLELRQR